MKKEQKIIPNINPPQNNGDKDVDLDTPQEMYEHHTILADPGQKPVRIDVFLTNLINKSRNKIQQAAKAGCILVNEKPIKANYKVRPNDAISIVLPKPRLYVQLIPEPMDLNILYEDNEVIILHKPDGLVVHPGTGNFTGTLVHGLAHHFKSFPVNERGHEPNMRPGLVHRLDKNTSGLMVVAKTEDAMTHLAKQFFDHTVVRRYIALVWGDLKDAEGTITGHIGRNLRNRKYMDVFPEGDYGKHAVTHYRVLERLGYVTLVECRLETGRTHQIRAHFKSIGHPLFGDPDYGGNRVVKGTVFTKYKQFVENCFKLLPRQALHAKILGFVHPKTKKDVYFESEFPDDIQQVLEKWRRYMGTSTKGL
ncbi:MAG: RluA family pseudouridine synthase [Chitinophagales bacterium]